MRQQAIFVVAEAREYARDHLLPAMQRLRHAVKDDGSGVPSKEAIVAFVALQDVLEEFNAFIDNIYYL